MSIIFLKFKCKTDINNTKSIHVKLKYFTYFRDDSSPFQLPKKYEKNDKFINGLSEYICELKEHIKISDSKKVQQVESGNPKITQLNFLDFQPGSVIAIR